MVALCGRGPARAAAGTQRWTAGANPGPAGLVADASGAPHKQRPSAGTLLAFETTMPWAQCPQHRLCGCMGHGRGCAPKPIPGVCLHIIGLHSRPAPRPWISGQQKASCLQAVDAAAIPVEAAEALLLWHDPWASARVFGGGLYALICLRHLVFGARRGRRCLRPV